jgi:hypothetical protein
VFREVVTGQENQRLPELHSVKATSQLPSVLDRNPNTHSSSPSSSDAG